MLAEQINDILRAKPISPRRDTGQTTKIILTSDPTVYSGGTYIKKEIEERNSRFDENMNFIGRKDFLVLIIDDDIVHRNFGVRRFSNICGRDSRNWVVSTAINGEIALQMCEIVDFVPDVILVDYDMSSTGGVLKGVDVVISLRQLPKFDNTVIIGCTCYEDIVPKLFHDAGCDAVWGKPLPPSREAMTMVQDLCAIRSKSRNNLAYDIEAAVAAVRSAQGSFMGSFMGTATGCSRVDGKASAGLDSLMMSSPRTARTEGESLGSTSCISQKNSCLNMAVSSEFIQRVHKDDAMFSHMDELGMAATGLTSSTRIARGGCSDILSLADATSYITSTFVYEDFEKITELCTGTHTVLSKARFLGTEIKVVLKVLELEKSCHVANIEFEAELTALRKIQHPHIMKIIGMGAFEGVKMLVFERMEGGTLGERLSAHNRKYFASHRPFVYNDVLRMASQLASALKYLHDDFHETIMILHRDLKPENIAFTKCGDLKLIDFGICTWVAKVKNNDGGSVTYDLNGATGTLRYMAPEVAACRPYNEKVRTRVL